MQFIFILYYLFRKEEAKMIEREKLKNIFKTLLENSSTVDNFLANSERVKRKIMKGIIFSSLNESDFFEVRDEVLKESVFDPINDTRSEDIFDNNGKMKSEVKEQILFIFNSWKEKTNIDFEISAIKMIGSMTGFQYTKTSDIDINVILKLKDEEKINELRKILPNGNMLENTNHPINFWIGIDSDKQAIDSKRFENIYNIVSDEWEKKSDKKDIKVPYAYVMEISKFFMDGFDLAISETERDAGESLIYLDYDTKKQELHEKDKKEMLSKKATELKADIDRLKIGKHMLRSFMVEGYEDIPFKVSINYENEDPRYSMNSMVYKAIERLGYHKKKIPDAIILAMDTIKKIEKYLALEAE